MRHGIATEREPQCLLVWYKGELGVAFKRTRAIGLGHGGKDVAQASLHGLHVEVAHHDDSLKVGAVPSMVEVAYGLARHFRHLLRRRYDVVAHIARPFQQRVAPLQLHAALWGVAHLYLLHDDGALLVYLFRVERQGARPVAHDPCARVEEGGLTGRHARETVDGLVFRCRGVDVVTVHHAMPLQRLHHALAGEMLGALKGHVLNEVGHAILLWLLGQRADVVHQREDGLTRHFGVALYIVGHAIGQLADDIRPYASRHHERRQEREQ